MTANRHQRRAAVKAAQEPGASQETKQEAASVTLDGAPADEQSQEQKQHAASEQVGTADSASPPAEPIIAGEVAPDGKQEQRLEGQEARSADGKTVEPISAGEKPEEDGPAVESGSGDQTAGGPDQPAVDGNEDGAGEAPVRNEPETASSPQAGSAENNQGNAGAVNDSDGSADGVTDPDGNPPGNEAPSETFDEEQDEGEVTPNVLAAAGAASMAYGTDIKDLRVDVSWLRPIGGNRPSLIRRANVLAKFIRDNPDAPYHAGVIHLQRSGFPEVPDAEPRGLVAYQVFAATLNALDRIDADAARAAEPKSDGKPAPIFADSGGMMPETGGLTAGGYGSL